MKPAAFDMYRPEALDGALELLSKHRDAAKLIAGGQSLVPLMNLRMAMPEVVIDLSRVAELRGVKAADGNLEIGAMTRQADLLADTLVATHAPLLRRATEHVGHVQTRARGTIGGSIAHADPAAELPAATVALGATFEIRSAKGARRVPAREFFQGALQTALAEDEILCRIIVSSAPRDVRATFREYARRHGDFAIVSVAAQFSKAGLSIALGGATPTPHLCIALSDTLAQSKYDPAMIASAVDKEVTGLDANSDIHASAEYRRDLAAVLLTDALAEVLRL